MFTTLGATNMFYVFVAFTELQTDLELVCHPSEGTLPFLDFRSFAMRFLFPRDLNHVVLKPLEVCGVTICIYEYVPNPSYLSVHIL